MTNVWPTLNGNAYVTDVPTMADEAFAATLLARRRDSDIYQGSISSLEDLMRRFKNDPDGLARAMTTMYTDLFLRLFDDVTVSITVQDAEPGTINYPLKIGVIITHDATKFDLGYELKTKNGATTAAVGVINGDRKVIL